MLSVLAVLLLLVLALLCFYLLYWNSDQRVRTAVSSGDYDRAVALMNENERFLKNDALLQLFADEQEAMVDAYLNETLSYEKVQKDLTALCDLEDAEIRDAAADSLADLEKVKACRDVYGQAEASLKAGEYEAAIAAFRSVTEDDPTYYALAQEQIEETTVLHQASLKESAEVFFQEGSYAEAVTKLDNAAVVYAEDGTYVEECRALMGEYVQEWITLQSNAGNYFDEDGAALLALTYENVLPEGLDADMVIADGVIHERVQLLLLYNEVRAELGLSDLAYNEAVTQVAQQQAEAMVESTDGSVDEPDRLLDDAGVDWKRWSTTKMNSINTAQTAIEAYGGEYGGYGEFKREYSTIGIGIAFDRETLQCSWYVLSIN